MLALTLAAALIPEESMAPSQDTQLEKVIEEVLKSGDVQALDLFLQRGTDEGALFKCSQQFLTKLDKLIRKSLDQKDSKAASVALGILYKCGKKLKLPGGCQGLSGLIPQGLAEKMAQWFEKCRQLWIQCGPLWNEPLLNLSEDFFDALMVVHEACKDGTYKITEFFLYPVGQLAVDPRIYILIQKEAIRKFNLILDKIPAELKKQRKILKSQEASDIMVKIAGQILECGDYDLQTALMEALCRMATSDQRKELAYRWFSMEHVAIAFVKISDSEFETDCRKFLNLVNGMQGDKRRVFSYPCLEAYLDNNELLMPADDKLEEFWIDFNLGSQSISFYFSLADEAQEGHWETLCINANEVQSYTVKEEGKGKILQLRLSEMVIVGAAEGSSLTIHFSPSLDILQAAQSVYGQCKQCNNSFVGKKGTSVVKTTVKITMEENNSQVVPESQMSLGDSEKNTAPYPLPAPPVPVQTPTPAKMRISESTHFISGGAGGRVQGASSLSAVMPSASGKGKPTLEMVRSSERQSESCGVENAETKAADKVVGGQEEEHLEQTFVPDTQPRTVRKISSYWNKLSVSEMIIMPTQKVNSQPRTEPSSLKRKKEGLSSAQKISAPVNSPISQKKLHAELTQRLQQVLKERNQDPAPQEEPAELKRKMSDSKGRGSADQCASKEQAQRAGPAIQKSDGQMSVEKDTVVVKASAKASTSKAQKIPPIVKAATNKDLSRKAKRDEAVAGSAVKHVSSRHATKTTAKDSTDDRPQNRIPSLTFNRQVFNMSWLSTATRKEYEAVSQTKTRRNTTTHFTRQREDVYAFSADEPFGIGGRDKTLNNTSVTSSSGIHHSSALLGSTYKEQPVEKKKRHVKKHLFSDTDTDHALTEVSWLRESSRKPKAKVTQYSRQARPKPVRPHTSYESPQLPSPTQKPTMVNYKPNKNKPTVKVRAVQPKKRVKQAAEPSRPHEAVRRPRRAAAAFAKSYREPDTDDSQSESDKPLTSEAEDNPSSATTDMEKAQKSHEAAQVLKNKTTCKQTTKSYMRLESYNTISLPEKALSSKTEKLERVLSETSKLKKKIAAPGEEQTGALKDSWAAGQTSFSLSPPFIERMRSAERSAPTLDLTCSPLLTPRGSPLPASPDPPCWVTPSPILLFPEPRSTVSSKGRLKPSSFYSANKKHRPSKTSSIQSVHTVRSLHPLTPRGLTPAPGSIIDRREPKISPVQQHPPSLPPSPLSPSAQPLLTSTLLEMDRPSMPSPPQSPFPEDKQGCTLSFSKMSSVSLSQYSIKSSVHSRGVKDSSTSALTVSHDREKTPTSDKDQKPPQLHVSGPNRKRHISLSSNSEEEEEEDRVKRRMRGQCSPRMKPRKLFKSYAELSVESEVSQGSSHWEAETGDGEMDMDMDMDMDEDLELPKTTVNPSKMCQQFRTDLKKKFQSRQKMVEVYSKQSMKTVQQHVSSLNMQVTKHRNEKLEQVQTVLLEEIQRLEQNETVLKNMEKDLTIFWKKQITAFCSYHEQEARGNDTLTVALQTNMCPSLEYEEKIFTSQMCLIRKDMKSVQDRLLSQMQEGELQSVKRGLHALFFP
ncbi:synaptonemal complex protein 2 [Cheilinus undulatus]|uniref:synaptonemal complex protein 2 n=1 Tax=Cheilinus undulatus TaxID=241271 RepID=UPI001BD508DB|nr:synaptonemal complex protein 2 [Cheilinus undulatus]